MSDLTPAGDTHPGPGRLLRLRPAVVADRAILELWDKEPHVISATTDDPDEKNAFRDHDWRHELEMQSEVYQYFIAELKEGETWRPIGAMQVIDPHLEPTHYWGEIEPNLRALDIWIGASSDLGKGHGEAMMHGAIIRCFADPQVTAIVIDPLNSNTRAHKFYQRIGFKPTHRQTFNDEDDCLVHRLTRRDWEARYGQT